jgi:PAS domain S-box-containing protein
MFDGLKVGMIASDTNLNITYINKRGEELFKSLLNAEDLVGKNMAGCHKPETIEMLKDLYQEYREKKKSLSHHIMEVPDGKATVVSVPFYEGDEFAGVVEFIFESTLG